MIRGIPPYSDRSIQSIRCACGLRYVVLVGDGPEIEARAEAARIRATFIDARRLLSFECYCGESLDVSAEGSMSVQ
jgi:hypothetical protein